MYEMKEEYYTGIKEIDEEHAMLFQIADELYGLINDEFIPDKFDYILEVINKLKAYAAKHFADEEAYMEKIHYKKMFTQKIQHQEFINKINSYSPDKIDEDQKEVCLELLDFISNWLIKHILENDKQIGK